MRFHCPGYLLSICLLYASLGVWCIPSAAKQRPDETLHPFALGHCVRIGQNQFRNPHLSEVAPKLVPVLLPNGACLTCRLPPSPVYPQHMPPTGDAATTAALLPESDPKSASFTVGEQMHFLKVNNLLLKSKFTFQVCTLQIPNPHICTFPDSLSPG